VDGLAIRGAAALALYAHACFLLGMAGWLRPVPVAIVTLLFAIGLLRVRGTLPRPRWPWLALLPAGVLALYPAIAFDETLYHLPFVQAFARDGAIRFLPDLRFPVFPVLHEALCVPAFLAFGDVGTHVVALVQTALVAALLAHWDARAGWLAAALFAGSPLVVFLASALHVEPALTLFVTAGFFALDRERCALAGFFFGSACSVKYHGFYFAAAALLIVLVRRRGAGRFVLAGALAALPMTAWLWSQTGDPLFPFLRENAWTYSRGPQGATLTLLWDVTFARERVGLQPPITPLLIPMAALLVVAAVKRPVKRNAFALCVLLVCAGYVVAFRFLPQDSRYLVPLLPLVSLVAARALVERWPKALPLFALIAIAPGLAYAGYRIAKQGVPPVTASQRVAWLSARIPEYRALRLAGDARVYACGGEQLKAHASGTFLGDHKGPWSYARVLGGAGDTRTIAARMRRIGVRFFLVAKRRCPPPRDTGGMTLVHEDPAAQLWRVGEDVRR